jgi:RNA polymerase-binding transcription factor DksA
MLQIDEPVGLPKDSADAACSTSTREALYQLGAVEAGAIAEIDHALEKIDEGTYGTCETCGKRISAARLKAIPSTCLCLACKRRQEARARARAEEAYSEPWRLASALDAEQAGEDSPELSVVAVRGRPNAA